MNFNIQGAHDAELEVRHGEDEDKKAAPDSDLVSYARTAARTLAEKLGGTTHVEIMGHETTSGRGFRPGHVSVTVSKVDPKA